MKSKVLWHNENNCTGLYNENTMFCEEAAYYIVSELHLGRVFPAAYFVYTNMPEDRSRILKWKGNWKIARQQ